MLRHTLMSPLHLPYGPVSIHVTPTGNLEFLLDDTMVDREIPAAMDDLGAQIVTSMELLDRPLVIPQTIVVLHAVRDVWGGRPNAVEFEGNILHGFVDRSLVKPEILVPYAEQATAVMRRFTVPRL